MTTKHWKAPAPSLGAQLMAMIGRHGSPEEKRLVAPHQRAISSFLDHPDVQPFGRRTKLDIGLENELTLKLNLVATSRASPWAMIDQFAEWAPSLRAASEEILRHRLHCHAGIKVSAKGVEYELYPYDTPDGVLANGLCAKQHLEQTGLPTPPYCYGISSDGTLNAYAEIDNVPADELESITGFSVPAAGLHAKALFHSRRSPDGTWTPNKAGIEFLPFPSHLLNKVLGHFNLHFAYLLHRGGIRSYGVVGAKGPRQVLYTTLFPRPTPGRTARQPGMEENVQ